MNTRAVVEPGRAAASTRRPQDPEAPESKEESLDPEDWTALRSLGHRMVDDVLEYLRTVRERPVWQSPPDDVRARQRKPAPREPEGADQAYRDFVRDVLPYPSGNIHPRFWGWVMGTGTPLTVLSEMLAAAVNPNVSGFDDGAVLVEEQVLAWLKELLGFPATGRGLLVTGGSMANFVGLAVARHAGAGFDVRRLGQGGAARGMTLYASRETHNSVGRAVELLGLGREALRLVPVDSDYRIDLRALAEAIAADRAAGQQPFAVVGNAGTVNTGATDDLGALADLCEREKLWLHVDGAFGALLALTPTLRSQVAGMERADSLAFDLHKWGYFPYEVGCTLVRDGARQREAFAAAADYLTPVDGGVAGRKDRFADYGPQLSRGFRALKVWMGLKAEGSNKLGRLIEQNVDQAAYLASLVDRRPELERLAPAPMNIVCFRYVGDPRREGDLDAHNRAILVRLHEDGIAVPSYTSLGGRFALRVAITNHRTRREDLELLVAETVRLGREIDAQ
ncbi:MAG: pyridoxal phosphate-dependent decarboxylase family protein [Solirubrobacterales bacterium]